MRNIYFYSHTQNQNGAALIEFAIIVPLLLLLVVGISEFGFAFYHLNILNKSVQDAARYFSDPLQARKSVLSDVIDVSSGNPAVENAKNLVIYGNITVTGNALMPPNNGSGFTFPTNWLSIPSANHIQLTAQYTHNFITGCTLKNLLSIFGSTNFPCSYNLTASSVLRVE
ncbi:MAG: pilus assembly protein [Methylococcales bacterium]|nr:pilus assembly protein [Methylococcales bacterium]